MSVPLPHTCTYYFLLQPKVFQAMCVFHLIYERTWWSLQKLFFTRACVIINYKTVSYILVYGNIFFWWSMCWSKKQYFILLPCCVQNIILYRIVIHVVVTHHHKRVINSPLSFLVSSQFHPYIFYSSLCSALSLSLLKAVITILYQDKIWPL